MFVFSIGQNSAREWQISAGACQKVQEENLSLLKDGKRFLVAYRRMAKSIMPKFMKEELQWLRKH